MIAWSQPRVPTIVNSNRFFPWYIQLSGGNRVNIRENRTGIQYGDQFLQGRINNLMTNKFSICPILYNLILKDILDKPQNPSEITMILLLIKTYHIQFSLYMC